MKRRCFVFKPDGIGDFILASGVIRLLAREFGEENLTIAVLPIMEPVVRGQFPKAAMVLLPLKTKRVILNLFAANVLRCFFPWLQLLQTRVDVSISLRNMRDYLQNVLFFSVRSPKRLLCFNLLLGNGRPVRRWTENAFILLFRPEIVPYPESRSGIPTELEAHRLLVSRALDRSVAIEEIWPELKPVSTAPLQGNFWVCAPFSSSAEKDFPLERWTTLFLKLYQDGRLSALILTGSLAQQGALEKFQKLLLAASEDLGNRTKIIIPKTLQDFIDLLAGAQCVMTVDTAAAHAATALNCRTLILFSGKHRGMFAPWSRSSRQAWLLPKASQVDAPWHSCHSDEEIFRLATSVLDS